MSMMSMQKKTIRSNIEIMVEMLRFCEVPQNKTRIMYNTNLSWAMLQKYLSQLQSRGFLEVHHSQIRYATTPKGFEFIEKWSELTEFL
jgi:predicted transcriptional regulator